MHKFVLMAVGVIIILIGIFMIANPKKATKADLRGNKEQVAKTKKSGIFVLICGIIVSIISIVRVIT